MQFKRVRIKDFGPINDLELEFEPNTVYHLVSENDSGKSMVLDAMNFLCCNVPGIHVKKYVADGKDSFEVEGEDFEGNIIKLVRGEENYYELTRPGEALQRFDKIGGNVPEEIKKIVNVYEDEVKKEKFNFRYAQDPILFINTTPGENYSYFQKALGTDKILDSLKLANTEYNKLVKGVDSVRDTIEYEKEKLSQIPSLSGLYDELIEYKSVVDANYEELNAVNGVLDIYRELDYIEAKTDVPVELLEYEGGSYRSLVEEYKLIYDILSYIDSLEEIDERLSLAGDVLDKYKELKVRESSLVHIGDILEYMSEIDMLETSYKLSVDLVKNYEGIEVELRKLSLVSEVLEMSDDTERLSELLEHGGVLLAEYENLIIQRSVLGHIKEMNKELDLLKGLLEDEEKLRIDLEAKGVERSEFLVANNYCPVVANSVDKRCPFTGKTLGELKSCTGCGGVKVTSEDLDDMVGELTTGGLE